MNNSFSKYLMIGLSVGVMLAACETDQSSGTNKINLSKDTQSQQGESARKRASYQSDDGFVNSMLSAAIEAEQAGQLQQAAVFSAKAYDREPQNAEIAWRYARLLRMNNRAAQSVTLLTPYSVRDSVSTDVLREYAAALLQNAQIGAAYLEVQRLKALKSKDPQVWNVMGIIADAYGEKTEAIGYFEKGLNFVAQNDERQKSVILNNMALAHAHQGTGDEAQILIKQAMTGAQYYPQIRQNFQALQDWPDGDAATNTPKDITTPHNHMRAQPIIEERDMLQMNDAGLQD